ncbi:MAG TPA: transcriptional regulator [Rhodobacteraceae bacterium]|nr:transcriptional regulator [Paracoccaceae bacterium]
MLTETLHDGLEAYRIGPKIRALRLEKGLALTELGAFSGLSSGMLSKIERGKVFATLPTLLRIALVFGVGLDHFFRADEERPMFEITKGSDRLSLPDLPDGDAAYTFESLDFAADRRGFEGFVAEFPAGGDASKPHEHPGEELVFVIEGALEITAHGRVHRLDAGDAVHFDAGFEHSYRGLGRIVTRALVVASRPPGTQG